jgi:UDP-N-acetylmuramate--alanine ligase
VIAVCGTHGKSSTTAMAARVLAAAGLDPTVVVGTKLPDLSGRNWRKGGSDLFLLEACEYRRSFHALHPSIVLLTNVDGDHFDAFATLAEYQEAFVAFLRRLPDDGIVITHGGDRDCRSVAKQSGKRTVDADHLPLPSVGVPGRHMQENARLVLALADVLALPRSVALDALAGYRGCWRRMEVKGEWRGATVVDDYGHHPREIAATLEALRGAHPGQRVLCVFQPHTHDRTLKLYPDFVRCFGNADAVFLTDVYEARKDIEHDRVDLQSLAADVSAAGTPCRAVGDLAGTRSALEEEVRPGDVVCCMGAGTITELAEELTRKSEV